MSRTLFRAASVLVLVVACKREPAPTPEPVEPKRAAADAFACPEGTAQRGAAPPDVWCETPGGVANGPFRPWYEDGRRKAEGSFDQGEAEGEWASWYETGQLRSRERYDQGGSVGQWDRFERDGAPQEAKAEVVELPQPKAEDPPAVIGIAACDLYIDRYRTCIDAKAPLAVKKPMLAAVDEVVEGWKQAAGGPGREALQRTCNAAYDRVKKTAAAWGCEM